MAVLGNSIGALTLASLRHPENMADIRQGLLAFPRRISSRHFYDDRGSELFRQITELEEYYLTRCELSILKQNAEQIASVIAEAAPDGKVFVLEAGPGDGSKAQILTRALARVSDSVCYGAVDISPEALSVAIPRILSDPGIPAFSIVGDSLTGIPELALARAGRRLFLFLGSNIGNYTGEGSTALMRGIRDALDPGDFVLIGFDLEKSTEVLLPAYQDSKGVTREFNLNLLLRLNRELVANFDVSGFEHHARYNSAVSAMQSFLVSTKPQTVLVESLGLQIDFDESEEIHTENSHKFSISSIGQLANQTGFEVIKHFLDSRNYFTTSLWKAEGERR